MELRDNQETLRMHTLCLQDLVCNFETFIQEQGLERRRPGPPPKLSLAQLAAVCVARSSWRIECWKDLFCNPVVMAGWKEMGGFDLGSYGRLMLRLKEVSVVLAAWTKCHQEPWTGMGAIDSTLIPLGKTWNRHDSAKYKGLRRCGANAGHGSTGPCFGVKLHLATNDRGGVHGFEITSASTHDLTPVKEGLLDRAIGVVLADTGYIGHKEQRRLQALSVAVWAKPAHHHQAALSPIQARLYRYREVAESVFAKLKQTFALVPRWPPRTMATCRVHILSVLVAYMLDPNKPRMNWSFNDFRTR